MGGTLARAASRGHRVVLVTATNGGLGGPHAHDRDAEPEEVSLGERRLAELHAAARILGVQRVVDLGYGDSGSTGAIAPPVGTRARFVTAPVEAVSRGVSDLLVAEKAELLITHDARGGYGHRDHRHAHQVALRAARYSRTPVVQATVPILSVPPWRISGSISVRQFIHQKRAALLAHASQADPRIGHDSTLRRSSRLPPWAFPLAFGREWFSSDSRLDGWPVLKALST